MKRGRVRIEKIEVENFKNVKKGQISLKNNRKNYKSSILGIYGQNGSGKTALIDAIMLLKLALCGQGVPLQYADYIHVESEYARLKFDLSVEIPEMDTSYSAVYEFKLRKEQNDNNQNISEYMTKFLAVHMYGAKKSAEWLILSIPVLKRCLRLEINIRN